MDTTSSATMETQYLGSGRDCLTRSWFEFKDDTFTIIDGLDLYLRPL